jgi:hypothetical protein
LNSRGHAAARGYKFAADFLKMVSFFYLLLTGGFFAVAGELFIDV